MTVIRSYKKADQFLSVSELREQQLSDVKNSNERPYLIEGTTNEAAKMGQEICTPAYDALSDRIDLIDFHSLIVLFKGSC